MHAYARGAAKHMGNTQGRYKDPRWSGILQPFLNNPYSMEVVLASCIAALNASTTCFFQIRLEMRLY